MSRAYICVARNDMADNMLQLLDVVPNSSLRIPSLEGAGQTGYITWAAQNDTIVTDVPVAVTQTTSDVYGLAAYLIDNVEDNDNGNIILTDARANLIATDILAAVTAGSNLTLAAIDLIIQARTGGAASGLTTAHSTGTLAEVLRIVSGESYFLADNSVLSAAGAGFVSLHYRKGCFLSNVGTGRIYLAAAQVNDVVTINGMVFTAKATESIGDRQFSQAGTDIVDCLSLARVINGNYDLLGVTARVMVAGSAWVDLFATNFLGSDGALALTSPTSAVRIPISGATMTYVDGGYRDHRLQVDSGSLHLSALSGSLSKLESSTYTWINPAFTYSATGTALYADGTNILAGGTGRAVTVYDATGTVI